MGASYLIVSGQDSGVVRIFLPRSWAILIGPLRRPGMASLMVDVADGDFLGCFHDLVFILSGNKDEGGCGGVTTG